jgi:acetyl esterase/lipase
MPSLRALANRFVMRHVVRPWLMAGSLPQQRARFAALAAPRFRVPARIEAVQIGELAAEWLTPANASAERVLYYLHGGAFVACSPATHRRLVARLARAAGMRALVLDYRLAPEHPFPAQLEDCVAGYRWLLAQGIRPEQMVIAGDSAGGALTLGTLVRLRDSGLPLPAAAVCLSPLTDCSMEGESFTTRASQEAMLGLAFCRKVTGWYLGDHDPRSPSASPLYADLRGLPPLLIHVGTHELLLDDSVRFAAAAERAGVDAQLKVWDGMWHVFHAFDMPEADAAVAEIGAFIRQRAV